LSLSDAERDGKACGEQNRMRNSGSDDLRYEPAGHLVFGSVRDNKMAFSWALSNQLHGLNAGRGIWGAESRGSSATGTERDEI
jgi:hypothetical protein